MINLHDINKFDSDLLIRLLHNKHHPAWLKLARHVSRCGDGWLYIGGAAVLLLAQGPQSRLLWLLVSAFAIERALYGVLKNGLKRDRPFRCLQIPMHINPSDHFSFPSGHTSAAFLFATFAAIHWPLSALLLYPLAIAIGLSRVVLGVHYPSDILAGAALGASCLGTTHAIWGA